MISNKIYNHVYCVVSISVYVFLCTTNIWFRFFCCRFWTNCTHNVSTTETYENKCERAVKVWMSRRLPCKQDLYQKMFIILSTVFNKSWSLLRCQQRHWIGTTHWTDWLKRMHHTAILIKIDIATKENWIIKKIISIELLIRK